jgi:hypothetical protein
VEQQRGRGHLGEAKWRELLERFDARRDTVEAFCNREGVTKSSFQRWRARVADGGAAAAAAAARRARPSLQPGFVDLGMMNVPAASGARLEITLDLGGGVTLRVARG